MHNEVYKTKKNIKEFTIALLSDIHYYPGFNTHTLNKLYKQILKRKPNYICITGDTIDDTKYTNLQPIIDFLNKLSNISPILIIKGNHDEKSGEYWTWKNKENNFYNIISKNKNIHYLNDTAWIDNNITFYGFNPSFHYYVNDIENYNDFEESVDQLKYQLKEENYNVLLIHSPINIYSFIEKNNKHNLAKSDLILSGHMHNGILPFWLTKILNKLFKTNRSIIAPGLTLFPKYAQGRVYKPTNGYIHEGITKFAKSTGYFHYLNFLYKKNVKFLTIKKID